jgi:hypothetical protein
VERGAEHPSEWNDYLITPFEKVNCKFLKLCANFGSFAPLPHGGHCVAVEIEIFFMPTPIGAGKLGI